jgi:hypothetical protein
MASVNAPRGLVMARKNGQGSNSTGVTMIPMGGNYNSVVPSALLPTSMFTGDPVAIFGAGTIVPTGAAPNIKSSGVFQGCSYVDGNGNQIFSKVWTGGATATDINLHVCTDPAQTYFIQADASVTAAAGFGTGVFNAVWTAGAGSTRTGNSGYELDADGQVLTVAAGLRVIRRAPWDTGAGGTTGTTDAFPWYEVRINNHVDNFVTATVSTA